MTQRKILDEFQEEDKLLTMTKFRLKRFKPSQRIYDMNKVDSFNIILDGKVGIFIEDHFKTKKLELSSSHTRDCGIVTLTEDEAEERRENADDKIPGASDNKCSRCWRATSLLKPKR